MTEEKFRIANGFLHFSEENLPEELKKFEGLHIYYSKDGKAKPDDPCIGRIEDVHVEGNAVKGRIVLDRDILEVKE